MKDDSLQIKCISLSKQLLLIVLGIITFSCETGIEKNVLSSKNGIEYPSIQARNIIFSGLNNYIYVNNYDSLEHIKLIVDEKMDLKKEGVNRFVIKPDFYRKKYKIDLIDTVKNKLLSSEIFKVKRIPQATAQLGNFIRRNNIISKKELLGQRGIKASVLNWDYDINLKVKRFNTLVYHKGKAIRLSSKSGVFTEKQLDLFKELKTGQYLIIMDIFVNSISKSEIEEELSPLVYQIN